MTRASYLASARAMALGAPTLAWFCAAAWLVFTPPLTSAEVNEYVASIERQQADWTKQFDVVDVHDS